MWRDSADRGTTLVELLVSTALFLFVLGVIYASLSMGLDAYQRTERFAALQQQAMRGMRSVAEDLAGSPRQAVRLTAGSAVLLSARGPDGAVLFDGQGRALWQRWVSYRLQDGGLVRRETALAPTPDVPDPVPTLAALLAQPPAEERVVAHDVTALDFEPGSPAGVRLTASNGDTADRTTVTLLDRVHFRQ